VPRYIDVTLDKPRRLRFDVNALSTLEKALTVPLGEIVVQLRRVSVNTLITCIQVGLLHEERNLTPDRVGHMIQAFFDRDPGNDFEALARVVSDALEASGIVKPDKDKDPGADPLAAT
jgi:hypothetical protein